MPQAALGAVGAPRVLACHCADTGRGTIVTICDTADGGEERPLGCGVRAGVACAVTRSAARAKSSVGFAIIHSKVLIDPFGDDPVVVTGSHNLSISASQKNDENFVMVRGDRVLAEAYAVNIQSAWRHYAARSGNPFHDLSGIAYLRALQEAQTREHSFWGLSGSD